MNELLTDAAVGPARARRFVQPTAAMRVAAGLARRPGYVARRAGGLALEMGRVAGGRSDRRAAVDDRRFADSAWQANWLLRRVLQGYLAIGATVDDLISAAELDWRSEGQARFAATNVFDALAPTNFPWSNPAVLREIVDQGGVNLLRGGRRFIRDVSKSPRLPATVDTSKFSVGGNLAVTPGAVVLRTDVFELIQYAPQTAKVRELPLLFVPPTINKYYVLDLAPGRSLIEHMVRAGHRVFTISWRNPDRAHSHFDLDTYAESVIEARAAVAQITRAETTHLVGGCSGGTITASALGHLAASGGLGDIAGLSLFMCALDTARANTAVALTSRETAAAAIAESARKGYLDGRTLAGVFAWMRPNDLIWAFVVNNYLLGKDPPAFDILYWTQDSVRLSAGLHRDFIELTVDNSLARPSGRTVLGEPVDLGAVELDSYVVAGESDHIIAWESAYRSAQLLGGKVRFVLSSGGHIQALVNPPREASRSRYRLSPENARDSDAWLEQAVTHRGSWWPDWLEWLDTRCGDLSAAPKKLGSGKYNVLAEAPGVYVHAS
ncbi:MAG TPA: alpha/beta fold hydrolase [Thermoleophilaceae bacterium]